MSFIQVDTPKPGITLVTLNRPERMNAMAFDVMVPLRDALREISVDNSCRVVVITGAGHGFCSGADLEGTGMVPNIDGLKRTSIARRALRILDEVVLAVRDMHQPVIAAVNGARIDDLVGQASGAGTLVGHVTLGPIMPVCREGVPCDGVYKDAVVEVRTKSGTVVAQAKTDDSGDFRVDVAAGAYTVAIAVDAMLPRCSEAEVVVAKGQTATVTIDCDTGIR